MPQQFDLGKAFQTARQGGQALNYFQDRNIAEQQRQRSNERQDFSLQKQYQAMQQKQQAAQEAKNAAAQKDMYSIFSTIKPDDPEIDRKLNMAAPWIKQRNPHITEDVDQFMALPIEEKKFQMQTIRSQMGIDKAPITEQLTIYGPNGETKRIPAEKGSAYTPPEGWSLSKPKGAGMQVYDSEGNLIVSTGGELSKKTQGTLEGGVISDMSSLQSLNNIETLAQNSPDLFTYGSQIGIAKDIISEKAGFPPTEEQDTRMRKWQDLSMNISQSFNTYRKEITGAAASEQELKRLEEDYINKKMSHTQFMQALKTLKTKMEQGLTLKQNLLQRGVKFNSKEYKKYFDASGFPVKGRSVERPTVNERADIIKKENPSFTSDKIFEILSGEGY